jgi:regulator of sigma E protease
MVGEEDPSDPRSLAVKPRWVRLVVLSAGAFMNIVLAIFLFSLALAIPRTVDISRSRIVEVVPGSPAEEAGLQEGDVIFAVDGRDVQNIGELGYRIRLNLGNTIDIRVRRGDGELLEIPVYARWTAPSWIDQDGEVRPQGPTGITISSHYGTNRLLTPEEREEIASELPPGETVPTTRYVPDTETQSLAPWNALREGAPRAPESLILFVKDVISRIKGGVGESQGVQVTGPVGIAQLTGEVVDEAGWKSLIDLAAMISMSLGVLNILPLPMLDGGRVVFVLLEFVRRGKRVAPEKEAMVHFVGLVAILLFAVVITYFDIIRIFSGEGILR